jgi:PAS domain-containing protein
MHKVKLLLMRIIPPVRMRGTVQDITERKRAEEMLRESEQRLQAVIDGSPGIIFLKDRAGRFILISNSRFEQKRIQTKV